MVLRDDFKRMWGDVPIVLCAEADYIGPVSYTHLILGIDHLIAVLAEALQYFRFAV